MDAPALAPPSPAPPPPEPGPAHTAGSGVGFWTLALLGLWTLRVPWLLSPEYILDGDEAVLGVMARHMAEGREFPVFFYGQTYGLALFETLPAAAAFRVFGDYPLVLSQAVLAVFLVGVVFHARALGNLSGSAQWGRILALVLAALPAWIVWSVKARGLYVSGFLLTGVALALLTGPRPTRAARIGAGVVIGLLWHVQPLWLTCVVPFVALRMPPRRDLLLMALAAAVAVLGPDLLARGAHDYWRPDPVEGLHPGRLTVLPGRLVGAFSGATTPHVPGLLVTLVGFFAATAFWVVLGGMAIVYMSTRARPALLVGIAMAASVAAMAVLRFMPIRYLLPCTVLLAVGAATWIGLAGVPWKGAARAASAGALAGLAVLALRIGYADTGRGGRFAERDLTTLLEALRTEDVRAVYSTSENLQWQLLFYGGEAVPVRAASAVGRYPAFPEAVDDARDRGQRTALVGLVGGEIAPGVAMGPPPGPIVGGRYFVLVDPHPGTLVGLGFELEGVDARTRELWDRLYRAVR